ncbi:MAG: hypothetical protein M1561_03265 [Gammaproteobacteria bacterium]|nr:hypothetical protein [Gammaproteobacteria bacterium]
MCFTQKLFGAILLVFLFATANAKVIELDNQNAKNCQKQILSAHDSRPIVLSFSSSCPNGEAIMPIFHSVAKQFPNRAFFSYDFDTEKNDSVFAKCIKRYDETCPEIIVMKKTAGKYRPYKSDEGTSTRGEIISIIR